MVLGGPTCIIGLLLDWVGPPVLILIGLGGPVQTVPEQIFCLHQLQATPTLNMQNLDRLHPWSGLFGSSLVWMWSF
jgi:hypothetical protein